VGWVALSHEVLQHAIRGGAGQAGTYDDWVNRRAWNDWNGANP